MARNRLVKKEFLGDERVGQLPFEGRLLFLSLWINADDTGHGIANPVLLSARTFPYDNISGDRVQELLNRMAELGMVQLYSVNAQRYYEVKNFLKHQIINKPSKFEYPKPGEGEDFGSTTTPLPEDSDTTTTPLPHHYRPKVKEKVNGKGKENEKANVNGVAEGTATAEPETLQNLVCESQNQKDVTQAKSRADETKDDKTCAWETLDSFEFARLDSNRMGKIDPAFRNLAQNQYARYRYVVTHKKEEACNCRKEHFIEMLITECEQKGVKYPKGLMKIKREMRSARKTK